MKFLTAKPATIKSKLIIFHPLSAGSKPGAMAGGCPLGPISHLDTFPGGRHQPQGVSAKNLWKGVVFLKGDSCLSSLSARRMNSSSLSNNLYDGNLHKLLVFPSPFSTDCQCRQITSQAVSNSLLQSKAA